MANHPGHSIISPRAALFSLYVAAVLTVVMVLFPPYSSLNGTEYAFILTGPAWSSYMGALGENLGLTARIHWALLLVQLGGVWAIALGAKFFLGKQPHILSVTWLMLAFISFQTI